MKRRILLIAVTAFLLVLIGCPNPTGSDDGDSSDRGGIDNDSGDDRDSGDNGDTGSGDENVGEEDESESTDDYTSPNIGTLVYVPAGSFQRDATATNISIISQPFRMSEHEITRSQFSSIMGTDPSDTDSSTGTDDPVQRVSWYDAIAFANKLSIEEGLTPVYSVTVDGTPIDWEALAYGSIPTARDDDWDAVTANWDADGYRLPTEMEWMWAAMGADQDAQPGAMQDGVNVSGYDKDFAGDNGSNSIGDYAWYDLNSSTTHPVGTKLPNELGLYDMSGNVQEQTWDWKTNYPPDDLTDYRGTTSGAGRVVRGGSFSYGVDLQTVAFRNNYDPETDRDTLGFRLVRP